MKFKDYIKSLRDFKNLDNIEINTNVKFNESSLARLYKHYKEHDSGTISAYRGENTKEENQENNKKLKNYLLANGYSVTQIQGTYEETDSKGNKKIVKEISFIVIDINDTGKLKKVLINVGKKFNQEAVTFSTKSGDYYLIMCFTGEEFKLGSPMFGKDGKIISKISGRPFIFAECEDIDNHTYNDTLDAYNPLILRYHIKNSFSNLDTI
ncbi:hypothetical phage protein [Campylobacter phage CP220]|uniref:Hypothetical phage protein n=1 Tax=Campylobacter phage CP220 TaxID=2994044 RepID=D5GVC3_9CAUD|nr:hypothetical protein APL47_gp189 [Campylobacter phage CP220]CBJ93940.1 hypothetical phage protein [Campylobacter phage CP220]